MAKLLIPPSIKRRLSIGRLIKGSSGYVVGDHSRQAKIIESFIALTTHGVNKKRALSKILPYALTVSQVDIGALLVVQSVEQDPTQALRLISHQGMPKEIIQQLKARHIQDQLQSPEARGRSTQLVSLNIIQTLLNKYKLNSLIGLPLQCNGHTLGAIVLGSRSNVSHLFNSQVQQQLATLAQLVSFYLDHLRLQTDNQQLQHKLTSQAPLGSDLSQQLDLSTQSIDDLERLLEAIMTAEEEVMRYNDDLNVLNQFSGELAGTLNMKKILARSIEQVRTALNAETGWIYLFEQECLVLYDHQGLSESYVQGLRYLKPGNGVDGMAYARNECIMRDNILFHDGQGRKLVQEEGLRFVLAVPLSLADKPFGVLAVGNRSTTGQWTDRDERMALSIGQRVSQAILNARMFSDLQDKAYDLEQKNSVLQNNANQISNDFVVLKQQIAEILKFQEKIWLTLPNTEDPRDILKTRGEMLQSGEQVIFMLKRALQVLGDR